MKLPLREPEHEALRCELRQWDGYVSSALLRAEAVRACQRYGGRYAAQAHTGLARIALIPLSDSILDSAARLQPPTMRTLDAIHLATALALVDDLGVVVAYDQRLIEALTLHDLPAVRPTP